MLPMELPRLVFFTSNLFVFPAEFLVELFLYNNIGEAGTFLEWNKNFKLLNFKTE